MDKGTWMIGAMLLLLSSSVVVLGQAQGHTRQSNRSANQVTAKNIAPDTSSHLAQMAEIDQLDQDAASALDSGDYAEAEDAAQRSVALGIASGRGQELLASALNAQGKTQEALRAYKVMADQGNDASRVLIPYALLLLKTGHWGMAVAIYDKALNYLGDGGVMGGQTALESTYGNFSPTSPAPQDLAVALHIAQGIVYNSSMSWGKQPQNDKALIEYQKALALEPNSALGHLYYAHGLRRMGRVKEAHAVLQKTVQMANGPVKAAAEQELKR